MSSATSVQIGDRVSFRIADVFLPDPPKVLANLTVDLEVEGVIVDFSDSGNNPCAYAMVRVTPKQMVLLPMHALRIVGRV